jgi:hypothetical protein
LKNDEKQQQEFSLGKLFTFQKQTMNSIFIYDIVQHEGCILAFGKSPRYGNETICWRINQLPAAVIYLELQPDYLKLCAKKAATTPVLPAKSRKALMVNTTMDTEGGESEMEKYKKLKLKITEHDIHKYVPGLESVLFEFDGSKVEYKSIAPVISFNIQNSSDDIPNSWNDEEPRKSIFVPEHKMEQVSLIHRAAVCQLPMIKVLLKNLPAKQSSIPSLYMDHTKMSKLYPRTDVFARIWRENLNLLEYFCLTKEFGSTGWLFTNADAEMKEIEVGKNRLTTASREFLISAAEITSTPPPEFCLPPPLLKVAVMDLYQIEPNRMELAVAISYWQMNKTNTLNDPEIFKFILDDKATTDTSTLAPNTYQFRTNGMFTIGLNEFIQQQDINVILAYKWKTWMQKQFAKLKINCSRFAFQNHTSGARLNAFQQQQLNRLGLIVIDGSKCFEHIDLFPNAGSYRLAHLAELHLKYPYQTRVLNPLQRVQIIQQLFRKFNTLQILFNWAQTCSAPWQYACDLLVHKMSEWMLLHLYHRYNFILRKPNADHRGGFNHHAQTATHSNTSNASQSNNNSIHHMRPAVAATAISNGESKQRLESPLNRDILVEVEESEEDIVLSDRTGGQVFEVEKGVHNCVLLMDFQSDYPSIIKAANLCPSHLTAQSLQTFRADNIQLSYFQLFAQLQEKHGANHEAILKELAPLPAKCAELVMVRANLKAKLAQLKS